MATRSIHLLDGSPTTSEARGAGIHLLASATHDWRDASSEGGLQQMAKIGVTPGFRACVPTRVVFRPVTLTGTLSPVNVGIVVTDEDDVEVGNVIPGTGIQAFTTLAQQYALGVTGKSVFPGLANYGLAFRLNSASTGTVYQVVCEVLGYLI